MIVIGVDPGPTQSAFVVWDGKRIRDRGILSNDLVAGVLRNYGYQRDPVKADVVVFEQVESFGMAVGKEVFETVFETGRLFQIVSHIAERMPRKVVKRHLCYTTRANNANIRAAILDRFGGKDAAVGLKKAQGPLYGVRSHEWSALAIALTWFDQHEGGDDDEKENGQTGTRSARGKETDGHASGDHNGRRRTQRTGEGVRRRTRRAAPGGSR